MLVSDAEYPKYWYAKWGLLYRVTKPGADAEFLLRDDYWAKTTAGWLERRMRKLAGFHACRILHMSPETRHIINVTVQYLDTGVVEKVQV
jgi:hypothetical protein